MPRQSINFLTVAWRSVLLPKCFTRTDSAKSILFGLGPLRAQSPFHGISQLPYYNVWRGDKSAFIVELAVEDWEALKAAQLVEAPSPYPQLRSVCFEGKNGHGAVATSFPLMTDAVDKVGDERRAGNNRIQVPSFLNCILRARLLIFYLMLLFVREDRQSSHV